MNSSCLLVWNLKCNSISGVKLQSSVFSSPFTRRTQLWTWELGRQSLVTIPGLTSNHLGTACTTLVTKVRHTNTAQILLWIASVQIIELFHLFSQSTNHSILYIQRTINAYSHSLLIKYNWIAILILTTFSRLLTRWLLSGLFVPLSLSLVFHFCSCLTVLQNSNYQHIHSSSTATIKNATIQSNVFNYSPEPCLNWAYHSAVSTKLPSFQMVW